MLSLFYSFIFLIVINPTNVNAQQKPTLGNFGGRVITTIVPAVTCAAQYGPITIIPAGVPVPGPFIIQATEKVVNPASKILGKYDKIMDAASCQLQTPAGPVPFPTFKIKRNFGASRF